MLLSFNCCTKAHRKSMCTVKHTPLCFGPDCTGLWNELLASWIKAFTALHFIVELCSIWTLFCIVVIFFWSKLYYFGDLEIYNNAAMPSILSDSPRSRDSGPGWKAPRRGNRLALGRVKRKRCMQLSVGIFWNNRICNRYDKDMTKKDMPRARQRKFAPNHALAIAHISG